MRRKNTRIVSLCFALLAALFSAACGSSESDYAQIEGPILDLTEVKSIVLDQFYINGGAEDEFNSKGEFAVYLRDGTSGKDVACTTLADGMSKLTTTGMYFGGLSIPLKEVDDEHADSFAYFRLVFVEQDDEGCPNPIGSDDEIVGQSDILMFDDLLGQPIWAANGLAATVLRHAENEAVDVSPMAAATEDVLAIDKLYFEDGGNESGSYILFAERVDDGESAYISQVEDSSMQNIQYGKIIYSALGFTFPRVDSTDPDFATMSVRVGLYAQREDGTELIAQTEAKPVEDLIGEKVSFAEGVGYVSFRGVVKTLLSSSVARLSDLIGLKTTSLEYSPAPSTALATIELHAVNADGGYTLACIGNAQGFTGVGSPGTYQNLSAAFVAANGQRELFGADAVKIKLIERTDGLACPNPPEETPMTLATSEGLAPSALAGGNVTFAGSLGSVILAGVE